MIEAHINESQGEVANAHRELEGGLSPSKQQLGSFLWRRWTAQQAQQCAPLPQYDPSRQPAAAVLSKSVTTSLTSSCTPSTSVSTVFKRGCCFRFKLSQYHEAEDSGEVTGTRTHVEDDVARLQVIRQQRQTERMLPNRNKNIIR